MKKILFALFSLLILAPSAFAQEIGKPAPDFSLTDSNGKKHALSESKGKYVVLEWYNPECPFVKKHYSVNNMQELQKQFTGKGVVWYTISSSAEGKQGYLTPETANELIKSQAAHQTALLLDHDGKVGKAYGAKTTPHMYVIDPQGKLIYAGAIDDNNSSDSDDIKTSKNYVAAALTEAMAGMPVKVASTDAYGCGIKYAS